MSGEALPLAAHDVGGVRAADADLGAAVDGVLASLLADKDVAEIAAVEGGLIEVIRRGRRERLQALLEGPLFALLRERGAEEALVMFRLPAAMLTAGPLQDGRIALCLKKPAPSDARLDHLVEEGLLPPGIDAELVAAVREGGGVAVVGPARAARARVVVALARMLTSAQRVVAIGDDAPAGCVPSPKCGGVVERAEAAVALGADILLGVDLSAADALALAAATLAVPVVAAVRAPSMASLQAAFGDRPVKSAFALVAVIGFAPDGRPRLVEMHGAVADAPPVPVPAAAEAASPAVASSSSSSPPVSRTRVATLPGVAVADILAAAAGVGSNPPAMNLGLGDAPPADWASSDIDDDPGWELGNLGSLAERPPAAPGSFDAALQQVAKRPTYSPKPPPPHPKTASLKGTGGLTLEPPPGSPADSPADDGGEE